MGSSASKHAKVEDAQPVTTFDTQGLSAWDKGAFASPEDFERRYELPVHWPARAQGYAASNTAEPSPGGIEFALNEKRISLDSSKMNPHLSLLDYLREQTTLTGTKRVCEQGGCGACTVHVSRRDDASGKVAHSAMNACLVTLASLDGAAVTTIEGLGNSRDGLHPIQQRMVELHGSQCGFCTPGIVMALYALFRTNGDLSVSQLEE